MKIAKTLGALVAVVHLGFVAFLMLVTRREALSSKPACWRRSASIPARSTCGAPNKSSAF